MSILSNSVVAFWVIGVQTLGISHAFSSFIWLCGPITGLVVSFQNHVLFPLNFFENLYKFSCKEYIYLVMVGIFVSLGS